MTTIQLEQYLVTRNIRQGIKLYYNKPGHRDAWKITSIKIWRKKRVNEAPCFKIGLKYGLYNYDVIDSFDQLHTCWLTEHEMKECHLIP